MKKIVLFLAMSCIGLSVSAEHLTIVGINDTHSMVLPDESDNMGGFARQRALIDSVRAADKNVLLLHAGDAVQGTPFFNYFKGEVEYQLLDTIGYDYIVLGNHEFDNGMNELYKYYSRIKAPKLCANYKFQDERFSGMFKPYDIITVGGKRVGIIGINVNPEGLISTENYAGMTYESAVAVANRIARELKEEKKVDYVIMLSHIGYQQEDPGQEADMDVLRASDYIDVVVGGHSHTIVPPDNGDPEHPSIVKNKNGRDVLLTQTGIYGKRLTVIDLDLESGKWIHKLIPINSRLDSSAVKYTAMNEWIDGFKKQIDAENDRVVCYSAKTLQNRVPNEAPDWLADVMMEIYPDFYNGKVQCAVINKGGIRHPIQEGAVSEGALKSLLPFNNKFVVLKIKGKDIKEAIKVMASRGGDGISRELYAEYDKDFNPVKVTLNGKPIKNNKKYYLITIQYLAEGGDFLDSFKNAKELFRDDLQYGIRVYDYLKKLNAAGKKIDTDLKPRMIEIEN